MAVHKMHEKHKEAIRATQLMNRMNGHIDAYYPVEGLDGKPGEEGYDELLRKYHKAHLEPSQVNAIQIIMKKLIPDLSSVEQKIVDERDSMTEDQIFEQMKALVSASPDFARKLREILTPTEVKKIVAK
jgi:hypothetical protein